MKNDNRYGTCIRGNILAPNTHERNSLTTKIGEFFFSHLANINEIFGKKGIYLSQSPPNIIPGCIFLFSEKVQVGKDQKKVQSEKDSHSKNRGGKKTKLTIRYLYHRKPNEQLFSQ